LTIVASNILYYPYYYYIFNTLVVVLKQHWNILRDGFCFFLVIFIFAHKKSVVFYLKDYLYLECIRIFMWGNFWEISQIKAFQKFQISPLEYLYTIKTKRYYFSHYVNSIVQFYDESVLLYRLSQKNYTEKISFFGFSVSYFLGHPIQEN